MLVKCNAHQVWLSVQPTCPRHDRGRVVPSETHYPGVGGLKSDRALMSRGAT